MSNKFAKCWTRNWVYCIYLWVVYSQVYTRFNWYANLMIYHIMLKWQQCKWNQWNGFYVVGYHSIMRKQACLATGKWDMSWWFWICLNNDLLCMNKKSLIVDWLWSSIEQYIKNAWVRKCQANVKWQRRQCIMDIRWSLH